MRRAGAHAGSCRNRDEAEDLLQAAFVTGLEPDHADVVRRIALDGEEPAAVASLLGVTPGNRTRVHLRHLD